MSASPNPQHAPDVLRVSQLQNGALQRVLQPYGLELQWQADGVQIAGSYWGDDEAGLVGNRLVVRGDTPVHSALHEACHFICMSEARRTSLDTDAGGGYDEENAVCFLQILLADRLPGMGRARMLADMDAWGYSFRLGSARAWFEHDADDAQAWLLRYGLMDAGGQPTGALRA